MIKIPEQFSVGFQKRDSLPAMLGYATHHVGKSLEKLSGFHTWKNDKIPVQVIDNKPINGFKLLTTIKRNSRWGSGRHVWRVLDPRGYVLEITSEILEYLIAHCDIIGGIIQGKCVWAWDGKYLGLLSEKTDEYKEAFVNTKRVNKKVSLKDIKRGDLVLLHNGNEVEYLGGVYVFRVDYINGHYNKDSYKDYTKCVRTYVTRDIKTKQLSFQSGLKVSEITGKVKGIITINDVVDMINKKVIDQFTKNRYQGNCKYSDIVLAIPKKMKYEDLNIIKKPVDDLDLVNVPMKITQYYSSGKELFPIFQEIECTYQGKHVTEHVKFTPKQRILDYKDMYKRKKDDPAIAWNLKGECNVVEFDMTLTGYDRAIYKDSHRTYFRRPIILEPNFTIIDGKVNVGDIFDKSHNWFRYMAVFDNKEFMVVK